MLHEELSLGSRNYEDVARLVEQLHVIWRCDSKADPLEPRSMWLGDLGWDLFFSVDLLNLAPVIFKLAILLLLLAKTPFT